MSFPENSASVQVENSDSTKRHAIVLGGSLGGMLAARVLRRHFDQVTLIERDGYPKQAQARKGVPQGNHLHVLMKRGQIIMEQLFPGLQDELVADGAHIIDMAGEAAWLTPAGWGLSFNSDLKMLALSRPLLDWHVRRRLLQDAQITILDNTEIVDLLPNAAKDGVSGVVICARTESPLATTHVPFHGDLVVDATGRASCAPRWLEALGYSKPTETVINAFLGYSSRYFKKSSDFKADWKCVYLQAAPPNRTRGAVMFPVEGDRWLLSLVGGGRDYPPTDDQGFLEFARSLPDPIIYNTIKDLEACSPISSYRAAENRLRHYEQMSRFPENFLVIGDAACAFNPVYAQGMTIAAMGASTLLETLNEQRRRFGDGSLKGLSRRFQKRLAKVNSAPWLLATGEDCRYRETKGASPNTLTRFMHWYMDQVVRLTLSDKDVRRVLLEAFHMLRKPTSLFQPIIILKVLQLSLTPRKTNSQPGRLKQRKTQRTSKQVLRRSESSG